MPATFFLKNLPRQKVLEDMAKRYAELKPSAVEAMLTLLRVASEISARNDARMASRKMSQGKFCMLMQLHVEPTARPSPSELAERMGVARATITGLLDGLERAGHIRRLRPPEDRRSQSIRLTAKGRGFLDKMLPGHYRRIAGLMSRLSEAERKTLVALLGKVAAGLKSLEGR